MSQAGRLSATSGAPTIPTTFTANTGSAVPAANNLNILGAGSLTSTGSGSTITMALTGLTNNAVLVGAGTNTITKVLPSATVGNPLVSQGSSADPVFSATPVVTSITISNAPSAGTDGVNKDYADAIASGFAFKTAVYASTTANLTATYANGASGVGATLTNSGAQAAFSTDGVSPPLNSRILVKNQSTTLQNGIYVLSTVGTVSTNWVLTRATDYDSPAEIIPGSLVPVVNGTLYANTIWVETSTVTAVGTDPVTFTIFQRASYATTQYATQVGGPNDTLVSIGPSATAGQIYQSGGSSANPAFSTAAYPSTAGTSGTLLQSNGTNIVNTTATYPSSSGGAGKLLRDNGTNFLETTSTYPDTNAVSTLLYASSANVMGALATANNGTLVTSNTGVPSILGGPGTTGNIFQSNAAAAPSFSTATYPSTTTISQILYSSSANVVSGLATANNAVLITSNTGVPSLLAESATAGIPLVSGGTGVPPAFTTAVVSGGGTGATTLTGVLAGNGTSAVTATAIAQGDSFYGSATGVLSALAKDTNSTRYLSNTGTSNNPAWAQVALSTGVSGQLPLANGGTNANLTASNGGIFYSTASAGAILSGTATAGQILRSGASAAPTWSTATYPATAGSSANVLTSDGTNWTSAAPAAVSGQWQLISTGTASSSSSIDFTGLSSTYYMYIVVITNLVPATNSVDLWMRTSTNNGSSYDAGAANYAWNSLNTYSNLATTIGASGSDTKIQITATTTPLSNNSALPNQAMVYLYNPSGATITYISNVTNYVTSSAISGSSTGGGIRSSASGAVNAIQFLMSSGNISTGTFKLYGVRAA